MSTISTNGWDVVIATTQSTINNGLNLAYQENLLPTQFSQTFEQQGPFATIDMIISGTFGVPTVTPLSVDSQTVQVTLPITEGSLSNTDGTDPIDISGMIVVVGVYLASIETELQPETGTSYDLVIDFSSAGAIQNVTLQNVPSGIPGSLVPVVETSLTDWLQNETKGQSYTVATFTLGNFAVNAPYLVPTLMEYAFAVASDNADGNNPFAMLMLTGSNTNAPQPASVPAGIIPEGLDFGALISNQILMSDMVLSCLAKGLNTPTSNFTVSGGQNGTSQIVTLNQPVSLPGEGSPIVTALSATVANNTLLITTSIQASFFGLGITYTGITANFAIEVSEASGGSQNIQFVSTGYNLPEPTTELNAFWKILIDTFGVVLAPILPFLTPIVTALIEEIIEQIADALLPSGSSSSTDQASFNVVLAQVQWNYTDYVDIASVSLPTPAQIVGTLPIVNNPDA